MNINQIMFSTGNYHTTIDVSHDVCPGGQQMHKVHVQKENVHYY